MLSLKENRILKMLQTDRNAAGCLTLMAGFLFVPMEAQAAVADTFGAIICNAGKNAGVSYPNFLAAIAYVVGAFLVFRGVLLLKKATDSGGQQSPAAGIMYLIGGALSLSLPAVTGVLQDTFFSVQAGGGTTCAPGAAGGDGSKGLDIMAQNFVKNIYGPIFDLLALLGYIVGVTFIFTGILRMSKSGAGAQGSDPKSILVLLVMGSVLMSVSSMLPTIGATLFGGTGKVNSMSSFSGIDWSGIVGSGADTKAADATIQALLAFIQIVGGIAFLRGWLLIKKASEGGQATIPQGATHIIGGAMAINIDVMLDVFDNTFGTNLIN